MKGSVAKPLIACRFDLAGNDTRQENERRLVSDATMERSRFKNDEAQLKLPTSRYRLLSQVRLPLPPRLQGLTMDSLCIV